MRAPRSVLMVTLMLGLIATPLAGAAQPTRRPYRIGVVHAAFAPNHPAVEGLKSGLEKLGFGEGRDVTFEIRFTEGKIEIMPTAVADLIRVGVDLIFTSGEAATNAARAATQQIPIVFAVVGDPVAAGVVAEIAHPGGNVTGVSSLATDLTPKRLEVLKGLVPSLRRVWAIYYAGDPSSLATVRKAQEAAPALKVQVITRPVRTPEELARALKEVRPGDGLLAPGYPTLGINGQIAELSTRVPSVFPAAFWVRYGALVSYGSDYFAEGRQAARLVAKILHGAQPPDLPVEGANRIELVINMKTAKALGLTVPQSLLLRADEIVQ